MPRKKISNIADVKLNDVKVDPTVTKVNKAQKANKDLSDVVEIKKKMSKVNLYLSLLNKTFFETVPIGDVGLASEIENEVNDFIISKAKSVFSNTDGISGFSTSELAFLKLLSRKGTEVKAPTTEAVVPSQVILEPTVEQALVRTSVEKKPTQSKSNILRKTVSIIGEDGNPKEVEVETEKLVLPPPTIKRNPPASFEQQMARAAADVAAVQRAMGTSSGPLVVDSTDSIY